jgi:hypothetical protein
MTRGISCIQRFFLRRLHQPQLASAYVGGRDWPFGLHLYHLHPPPKRRSVRCTASLSPLLFSPPLLRRGQPSHQAALRLLSFHLLLSSAARHSAGPFLTAALFPSTRASTRAMPFCTSSPPLTSPPPPTPSPPSLYSLLLHASNPSAPCYTPPHRRGRRPSVGRRPHCRVGHPSRLHIPVVFRGVTAALGLHMSTLRVRQVPHDRLGGHASSDRLRMKGTSNIIHDCLTRCTPSRHRSVEQQL